MMAAIVKREMSSTQPSVRNIILYVSGRQGKHYVIGLANTDMTSVRQRHVPMFFTYVPDIIGLPVLPYVFDVSHDVTFIALYLQCNYFVIKTPLFDVICKFNLVH